MLRFPVHQASHRKHLIKSSHRQQNPDPLHHSNHNQSHSHFHLGFLVTVEFQGNEKIDAAAKTGAQLLPRIHHYILLFIVTTSNLAGQHSVKIKYPQTNWPYSSHHPFYGFPLSNLFADRILPVPLPHRIHPPHPRSPTLCTSSLVLLLLYLKRTPHSRKLFLMSLFNLATPILQVPPSHLIALSDSVPSSITFSSIFSIH